MIKQLACIILFMGSFLFASAQTLDTAALKNYSASVLMRVHDVGTKVVLTTSEQQVLANLFANEEQELRSMKVYRQRQERLPSEFSQLIRNPEGRFILCQ